MAKTITVADQQITPFERLKSQPAKTLEFLKDVRAEMRKVVAPSPKEVRVTTSVVIVAVFIFGVYFFIVDWIFRVGVNSLLQKLGGLQ